MKISLVSLFLLISCATYTDQTRDLRANVISGDTDQALKSLNSSAIATRKRDEVLFLMERGMLHYISGSYEKANKDWEKSFYRSEELYTISISRTAASLALSEDVTDYEGEDHERVLVPIFSALSYCSRGDFNSALVEVRRAYQLITKLKLDSESDSSRIDGFPFLISGLLYEANASWDAAIIEYRKALKNYQKRFWENSASISKIVADSLWRIAEHRGRKDIIETLEQSGFKKPNDALRSLMSQGEVIIILENGQSPIKVPKDFPIQHSEGIMNISFPVYQSITNSRSSSKILCNGILCERSAKASDISALAEKALENRRIKEFSKMTARLIIKEGTRKAAKKHFGELGGIAMMIANAATERADTRSWTMLPENIQIARVAIPANTPTKISVETQDSIGESTWIVEVPAGKKKFLRMRSMN